MKRGHEAHGMCRASQLVVEPFIEGIRVVASPTRFCSSWGSSSSSSSTTTSKPCLRPLKGPGKHPVMQQRIPSPCMMITFIACLQLSYAVHPKQQ
jgi:hypothetical protein